MNNEAQRIAIAQACGLNTDKEQVGGVFCYRDSNGRMVAALPDYLNDKNAIREAWNIKPPPPYTNETVPPYTSYFNFQCELGWQLQLVLERELAAYPPHWKVNHNFTKWNDLIWSAKNFLLANATAAQMAEAFLKTTNLFG